MTKFNFYLDSSKSAVIFFHSLIINTEPPTEFVKLMKKNAKSGTRQFVKNVSINVGRNLCFLLVCLKYCYLLRRLGVINKKKQADVTFRNGAARVSRAQDTCTQPETENTARQEM